jgi:hypothetical protein
LAGMLGNWCFSRSTSASNKATLSSSCNDIVCSSFWL